MAYTVERDYVGEIVAGRTKQPGVRVWWHGRRNSGGRWGRCRRRPAPGEAGYP